MYKAHPFYTWSLSTQLQLIFTVAFLILSATIITITSAQLNWFNSQTLSLSNSTLTTMSLNKMLLLSQIESRYISIEYKSYFTLIKTICELNHLILGRIPTTPQPLGDRTPLWEGDAEINFIYYNTSIYSSRLGKPRPGSLAYSLIFNISRLDWLVPILYKVNYLLLYEGFEADEMTYNYPGESFGGVDTYTPLVREWYYNAKASPNKPVITEPYIDPYSGGWIFTISQALTNNNPFLGVAAVDISLSTLTEKLNNVKFINKSYILLISKSGILMTPPDYWNIAGAVKIYNETITGFSYELWQQVLNASQGDFFLFTDLFGTNFTTIVGLVQPYEDSDEVTHYILIMAESDKLGTAGQLLKDKTSEINTNLFWTVLSCIVFFLFVGIFVIYLFSVKLSWQLRGVGEIFVNMRRRALFFGLAQGVDIGKIDKYEEGIEGLVDACKNKLGRFIGFEMQFRHFCWNKTRPSDKNLHSQWSESIYPFNRHYENSMNWRKHFRSFILYKNHFSFVTCLPIQF